MGLSNGLDERLVLDRSDVACGLPTWDVEGEPLSAWSVAAIDDYGSVTEIAEKALPQSGGSFRGVIGCYYFADAALARSITADGSLVYISDIVRHYLASGRSVVSAPVEQATFFGDPARLQKATLG